MRNADLIQIANNYGDPVYVYDSEKNYFAVPSFDQGF